jgi:CARDB
MSTKGSFIKAILGSAVVALMLGLPPVAPGNCARAPGPDVLSVPAPPGPPPEIRQVPPPVEIRQIKPPEDMRQVAPPPGVGSKTAGEARQAGGEPDLQLGGLGLSSANPKVGERVFATVTLRNNGSQGLTAVRVRFFLGQVEVGERVVAVAAGGKATASLSFKATTPGAQKLRVQADPGAGLGPLTRARGLTVIAAAKTDVEDFTTPRPKAIARGPEDISTPQGSPGVHPVGHEPPGTVLRPPGSGKPQTTKLPKAADLKRVQDDRDVEDFTTPTSKPMAEKELPPQRLTFHKPDAAKGEAEPENKVIKWGRTDKDKGGTGGDKGGRGDGKGGDKGEDMEGLSPLPDNLREQTRVGRGPHGEAIGWGDGIYGVEDKGTGIPAIPAGLAEFDKLVAEAMKGFPPGTGGPDLGFYGGINPGIGLGLRASGGGSPGFNKALNAFRSLQGQNWVKNVTFGQSKETGQTFVSWKTKEGSTVMAVYNKDGSGYTSETSKDGELTVTDYDKHGNITKVTTYKKDQSIEITTYENGKPKSSRVITPAQRKAGATPSAPEGAGVKPSPKTPDPKLVHILMKDPGKSKVDPRIGQVGDPPQLAAVMTGAAPAGAEAVRMAAGGGKITATWLFTGVKPGAFLKGPRDPNLPGGKWGKEGGLQPDLRRFILPDPPEAQAIVAALAKTETAAAPSVTVSEVRGAVQVLATQEGQQGWAFLVSGDKLSTGSVIRTGEAGGQVGVGDVKNAFGMQFTAIHKTASSAVYLLQIRK